MYFGKTIINAWEIVHLWFWMGLTGFFPGIVKFADSNSTRKLKLHEKNFPQNSTN